MNLRNSIKRNSFLPHPSQYPRFCFSEEVEGWGKAKERKPEAPELWKMRMSLAQLAFWEVSKALPGGPARGPVF